MTASTGWDVRTEMLFGTNWRDITDYTQLAGGGTATRGLRSERSTAEFQSMPLQLDNRNRWFSPRLPSSPGFGLIGRNTQVRQYLPGASSWLQLMGYSDCAFAVDAAGLDVTGDIDVRVDAWLPSWHAGCDLIGKYLATGNQRSWELYVDPGGVLVFAWSADGTAKLLAASTTPLPAPLAQRRTVRATLDVNNGAGGWTVTFYTGASVGASSWTQLGDPVSGAGVTSIFNSGAALYLGDIATGAGGRGATVDVLTNSKVYAAQVRNGIAGTVVANPDFTGFTHGTTTFTDSAGNPWFLQGSASIVARDYRAWGEVPAFPQRSDLTGNNTWVPVTVSGILRRLGKGSKPTKSAYYRGCTSKVAPVTGLKAYWPMEETGSVTSLASGMSGGRSASISGPITLASDSSSFACSSPLPVLGACVLRARVTPWNFANGGQVRFLLTVPSGGVTNNAVLARVTTLGSPARWDVTYTTGGNLAITAYDSSGTSLGGSGAVAFGADGVPMRMGISFSQNGSGVDYWLSMLRPGSNTGTFTSGTIASTTIGAVTGVDIAPNRDCSGATVGHLTVQSDVTSIFDLDDQLAAYTGETATDRIRRLCREESIACEVVGASPSSPVMGPQTQQTILSLLRECEAVDGGVLHESREFLGLRYVATRGLVNQSAALTVRYDRLSPPFDPDEDDQATLNDLTLSRTGGSSVRVTKDTGALSTLDPPNGVGVYDAQATVNVQGDGQLASLASWMVHLGTVDEPRFSALTLKLDRPDLVADQTFSRLVSALDVGARVDVTDLPDWFPPKTVRVIVVGCAETLTGTERSLTLVCQPEAPYRVLRWGDSASRWCSPGSTVNGAHTLTTTSLSVATIGGGAWGHASGDYLVDLSTGEQCLVTGVAGATSPQTFTVVRGVNGVQKALVGGETVQLSDARVWAL